MKKIIFGIVVFFMFITCVFAEGKTLNLYLTITFTDDILFKNNYCLRE